MTLDGERFPVEAGDITAVYPGGEHGLENDGEWATDTVRRMMEEARAIDAPHRSLVLEGYDHGGFLDLKWPTVVEASMPQVFEFFAQHRRE